MLFVLISGGTGAGKTHLARAFAQRLELPSPMSTDAIREVLRAAIPHGIQPALHTSTYLAGQTENYRQKDDIARRTEVLRGYKAQAKAVEVGIDAVLRRAVEEREPAVIEGIHIRPGAIAQRGFTDVLQLHIAIPDTDTHRQRFEQRMRTAPARSIEKYLQNYEEIRWVAQYLEDRAAAHGVPAIDNSGPTENAIAAMVQAYERFTIRS